ncbi:MAG TPA: methyltransferase domain-containing protein [Gemmatimonadaceae bacterium]|nr:methyltransferase domain-containing protein [Gemmatimonadaceae bacterium]
MTIPDEEAQQNFWNDWNARFRGATYDPGLDPATMRRRNLVLEWVENLGLQHPRILEVGCATGWLTCQLAKFGEVVGTDIADASIREARDRYPGIRFECGDLSQMSDFTGLFDVVVCLETLSHVPDQRAFLRSIYNVVRPGGFLILTTQNRVVFERRGDVTPRAPGQIRRWVSPAQLRRLAEADFEIRRLTTLLPEGNLGFLRVVNSPRLNRWLRRVFSTTSIDRLKERIGLGQTIAVLAQRPTR